MKIERHFTTAGEDVFETVAWTKRSSRISNLDGSVVFEMNDAEVPASWSQLATDIMVSKYFRKAGVPRDGGPNGIAAHDYDAAESKSSKSSKTKAAGKTKGKNGSETGPEKSARQVIHRLAGCWRHWGESHGYFDTEGDAQAFYDELCHMMLHQMSAPNSPQWFNTGLNWAYGIDGPAQGHWFTDPDSGETKLADSAYAHPQPHACFIQSCDDDLVNPGGIMDLWVREARLFKYGSGTGTNFSLLRGENEPLSGGGKSSGLMSFLKIGDRAAGAIKSGGTTRRAAKMVCLDLDHPDIENFIDWKVREEIKVAALVEGMKNLPVDLKKTAADLGLNLTYDFNGEAYATVSGQNSNNSIRIPNTFFEALDADDEWNLMGRTDGSVIRTLPARHLWDKIAYAAWRCADPGVQYDTTINQWHTCPESGRINASNPCSEYMFLDNTACNLASLNLIKFYDSKTREFDLVRYEHGVKLWTMVLEISVLMAAFPSREIARLSYEYRTLGLGYANIGAMLMQAGIPYDSEEARALCGAISAILTGRSYATSAEMSAEHGPFPGYFRNREHMLRVIANHRRAAYGVPRDRDEAANHDLGNYQGLEIAPVPIDGDRIENPSANVGHLNNASDLLRCARVAWDDALRLGKTHGFRNAQSTVIAPTGTIGLLMDCDTTGVEPDFALVKFKKLAGGGYFKIANQSLRPALDALGYDEEQVRDVLRYVMGTLDLDVELPEAETEGQTLREFLVKKGVGKDALKAITESLPTVFELSYAFNAFTVGEKTLEKLELADAAKDPAFNLLAGLGLSKSQISKLNALVCGTQTVEGAPHLKPEHLPVFDCANTCGPTGERFIAPEGHIRMMGAAQPFISGAISKTINLPNSADIDAIKASYRLSWELGLKANALYRDGCKLSQVLSNKIESDTDLEANTDAEDDEAVEAALVEVTGEVVEVASTAAASQALASDVIAEPVQIAERIVEKIVERPLRRRLPDTRTSKTHKFNVAGHEGYLTVGLYDDGQPGELFITMAKEGSTIGGLMDSLGTAISVALQYGVPVDSLVAKFTHQRFEPAGMTHNPDIPFAKSLVDYIFRWMGMEFVAGYRAANAPRRGIKEDAPIERAAGSSEGSTNAKASGNGNNNGSSHGNGTNGAASSGSATGTASSTQGKSQTQTLARESTLTAAMREMQTDAPACDVCGTITVRNGTCYKCMNCGNSMGCS